MKRKRGYLTFGEFEDPRQFFRAMPRILEASGLEPEQARLVWSWRAHARRKGKSTLGLFVYMMKHPGQAREVSDVDEDQGGADQQAGYRPETRRSRVDKIAEAWRVWRFHRSRIKAFRRARYRCTDCDARGARGDLRMFGGRVYCCHCYGNYVPGDVERILSDTLFS